MSREVQENKDQQFNGIRKAVEEQNEKFKNRKHKTKQNPEILELRNALTTLKDLQESPNSRLDQTEERIGELKGRLFAITQFRK